MSSTRALRVANRSRCGQPHRACVVLLEGKPPAHPAHAQLVSEGRCGACRGCLAYLRAVKRENGEGGPPLYLSIAWLLRSRLHDAGRSAPSGMRYGYTNSDVKYG